MSSRALKRNLSQNNQAMKPAYASSQPLKDSERPQRQSLPEAMDKLERARRYRRAQYYVRPIHEGAKAISDRIMGESSLAEDA